MRYANQKVVDYAFEGKAIVKIDDKVFFVEGVVPGDNVDIEITKNKKNYGEAVVTNIVTHSPQRVTPFCQHFGVCGGCKWQMLDYQKQFYYKKIEVIKLIKKIGLTEISEKDVIDVAADKTTFYRNKLEFAFSNKIYLTPQQLQDKNIASNVNSIGFHVGKFFDKVIPVNKCWLLEDVHNLIRQDILAFAQQHQWEFYDRRQHLGWLRNLTIRYTTQKEMMLNLSIAYDDKEKITLLFDFLIQKYAAVITSLYYTVNSKKNDTLYDLTPVLYFGKTYVTEKIKNFIFNISPLSFFQTNSFQTEKLYQQIANFASLNKENILYDMYCGTGTIGIFLSQYVKKVIGVEILPSAVKDAEQNAILNHCNNIEFICGDATKIINEAFFKTYPKADVIVVDPPRSGLTDKLIQHLISIEAKQIIYVSCNPATLARDIALFASHYTLKKLAVVDMFPHTYHIESVALLEIK